MDEMKRILKRMFEADPSNCKFAYEILSELKHDPELNRMSYSMDKYTAFDDEVRKLLLEWCENKGGAG